MGTKFFGNYDPSTQISNYFTLGDLTVTQQKADNTPSPSEIQNLEKLGYVLDTLWDYIGPFDVVSAFRSKAVQTLLTESGAPTAEAAAGKISFHEVGLAADIFPTTMSLDEFFGKMVALIGTEENPGPLWDMMAEVSYKPTQNTIHLAAGVDYRANNVIMSLNSAGKYVRLTADEIMDFAKPYLEMAQQAVAAVATPMGLGTIMAVVIGGFLLYTMTKSPREA